MSGRSLADIMADAGLHIEEPPPRRRPGGCHVSVDKWLCPPLDHEPRCEDGGHGICRWCRYGIDAIFGPLSERVCIEPPKHDVWAAYCYGCESYLVDCVTRDEADQAADRHIESHDATLARTRGRRGE